MYLCHPDYSVKKLSRTGHTSWTITEVDFTSGPYLDDNITTTTFTMSAFTVGASRTLTASAVTGINNNTGFQSTDVGRLFRFRTGHGEITAITSTTVVTATVIKDMTSSTASTDWALGAFSDTTGHPSCVTFYEQRLVFAGTTDQPQTLFFSRSGDYENMDENRGGTVAADEDGIKELMGKSTKGIAGGYTISWPTRSYPSIFRAGSGEVEEDSRRKDRPAISWLKMVDNIAGGDRTKWDFFLNMPLVEFLNAVSFQTEKDRARTERLNTAAQSAKSAKDSTVYKIALLQEML